MKNKRLWEVLREREKGIKETSELTRAIRVQSETIRAFVVKRKGWREEWAAILQFANNNGYI